MQKLLPFVLLVSSYVFVFKFYPRLEKWFTWVCKRCVLKVDNNPVDWQLISFASGCIGELHTSSVQFSHSIVSDSLQPHGLQHTRPPCPSPTSGAYSNSCPLSWWCHPTISSSFFPFSSHLQSFPASGSFQMSEFSASGGQRIRVSALVAVLSMNIQDWFPSGWTGWISLQSKGQKVAQNRATENSL